MVRGVRWLRRHVRVVAEAGRRTVVVSARTSAPEITIALRRHPGAGRVTIEAVEP